MITDSLHYFKLAIELNEKHADLLQNLELHCRGNLNSMSLISVNKDTPERGFSNIENEDEMLNKSEVKLDKPGRPTPEKVLQAWVIKYAFNDVNHMLPFGNKIKFITSEMAAENNLGKKYVNDILGFSSDGELCIIELKYARHLTRLVEQIEDFEEYISDNNALFIELLKIHNCEWDGNKLKRIIVWPHSKNPRKSTLEELSTSKVTAYGYIEKDDMFEFKV